MITVLIRRLCSDVKVQSDTKTLSKKLYCLFWQILAMYFDLLGKATHVHSLAGMCCVCSGTAWVVKLWCCCHGSCWCSILRSGVPRLWQLGRWLCKPTKRELLREEVLFCIHLAGVPRNHSLPGWSFPLLSSPTKNPLGLVTEKLCLVKIMSVLLACQSGRNRGLSSTSTWIPYHQEISIYAFLSCEVHLAQLYTDSIWGNPLLNFHFNKNLINLLFLEYHLFLISRKN